MQAVNNLLSVDENEVKIVDSGVLDDYVQLLSADHYDDESIQTLVSQALFTLAFRFKQRITLHPRLIDGLYIISCLYKNN